MLGDEWKSEGSVMRGFEAMCHELDIAGWTATQGNRNSISSEVVTTDQMGGSIKKAQVGHVIITVAKSLQQKEMNLATIAITKSRIGKDGIIFENCKFDNGMLDIDTEQSVTFLGHEEQKEEKNVLRRTIDKLKGAENAGKAVAFFANSAEQMPKIESLPTNSNDKLFQEASALNTEQICFSHTIDPILMGVRTTGSLGGGADIKQAYVIFEKNVVKPLREIVQDIFNELLHISKVKGELVINNFQIINETIVEVDEEASALATRLSSLNPELLNKVLENMTPDEIRSLASLPPVVKSETPA